MKRARIPGLGAQCSIRDDFAAKLQIGRAYSQRIDFHSHVDFSAETRVAYRIEKSELQMRNPDMDYEGSFLYRQRRRLVMVGVVAALVLTVIVYNRTGPEPSEPFGAPPPAAKGGTLAVGALPVT